MVPVSWPSCHSHRLAFGRPGPSRGKVWRQLDQRNPAVVARHVTRPNVRASVIAAAGDRLLVEVQR